mgnify:CR=1 FL=1
MCGALWAQSSTTDSAHGVGALDDLLHGGAQAQHIGDHCNADQLGLGGNFLIQFVQRQAAVLTGYIYTSFAPVASATRCQGTRLE